MTVCESPRSRIYSLRVAFDKLAHDLVFSEAISSLFHHAVLKAAPAPAYALDIGCGTGGLSRALVDAGFRVVGIDFSPTMVSVARSFTEGSGNPTFEAISISEYLEKHPERDFNLVVTVKTLHHLSVVEIRKTVLGIAEHLLAPNGRLIVVDLFTRNEDARLSFHQVFKWFQDWVAGARAIGIAGLLRLPWAWVADRRLHRNPVWRQHLASEVIPSWQEWDEVFSSLNGRTMKRISPRQFMLIWAKADS